ncbi:hypothetical protein SAMN04488130_10962 [Flavobacterium urumqiense]|uniref:Uncharacterized protein n=1 Tax=Flavobacterium urumqiense TaxID=935224 RepID=A0A1H5Z2E4_9FLAO|nr:hypothetical protein SAMN04488130_10962 [Flavobacterium urumqiense]
MKVQDTVLYLNLFFKYLKKTSFKNIKRGFFISNKNRPFFS